MRVVVRSVRTLRMRLPLTLRGLLRAPAFSLTSIVTLALAVCLSTTVFAVVDGVLFKSLPFSHPDQLYLIGGAPAGDGYGPFSGADIAHLRDANPEVPISLHGGGWLDQHPSAPGVQLRALGVDSSFFDVLGLRPMVGGFTRADFARSPDSGDPEPAVVSYQFWQRHARGDAAALGSTIRLTKRTIIIAGVLPPGFALPDVLYGQPDFIFPLPDAWTLPGDPLDREFGAILRAQDVEQLSQIRRRSGVALASAAQSYGAPDDEAGKPYDSVNLVSLNDSLGLKERPFFRLAFAVAILLVLIACVNVTSLALARTRDRTRELRVRLALGASRRDIAVVVTGDVLLVTIAGAALGLWLAGPMLEIALRQMPGQVSTLKPPTLDWRVATFAFIVPLTAMLVFSLIPVSRALRDAPISRFATGTTPPARSLGPAVMLAVQSGLGIVLLIAGALVLASFGGLRQAPVGLRYQELGVVDAISTGGFDTLEKFAAFQDRVHQLMTTVPGVDGAAIVGGPLLQKRYSALHVQTPDAGARVWEVPVSSGFFAIAGLRLIDGRLPLPQEIERVDPVAVLSRPAARALFGDASAVGRAVKAHVNTLTVVGVVEDVRIGSQTEGEWGEVFTPIGQSQRYYATYLFRVRDEPDVVASRVATTLSREIPGLVVVRAASLGDALADTVTLQRFQASLFGITAVAALLLISAGIAVLSSAVCAAAGARQVSGRPSARVAAESCGCS